MKGLLELCVRPTALLRRGWWALPLRRIVGYGFMEHGYAKVARGPEVFIDILHALHMPAAPLLARATRRPRPRRSAAQVAVGRSSGAVTGGRACIPRCYNQRMKAERVLRMTRRLVALALLLGTGTAFAAQRPVVVQLFTSLGCSDCPPADALLARISEQDHDVLALDLHVTYWNDSSWSDPYSLRSVNQLQSAYAALRHDSWIYTPEAVVDGGLQFVGSNPRAMANAIARAKARIAAEPLISAAIHGAGRELTIAIGSGAGTGTVWLFGFEPARSTRVQGGENAGATVSEVNVVTSITRLGDWRGSSLQLRASPPAGTKFAVILQRADGTIAAAAST